MIPLPSPRLFSAELTDEAVQALAGAYGGALEDLGHHQVSLVHQVQPGRGGHEARQDSNLNKRLEHWGLY